MRKLLIVTAALLMCSGTAFGGAFMKLGDIKGEATDNAHKDWIIIESMSQGLSQPGGGATGQARRRGAAVAEPLVITRKVSLASPSLALAAANGKVFPMVELETTVGSTKYRVRLENATITSYQVSGSGDEVPTEEVAFYYNKITWAYVGAGANSKESWDFGGGR